MTPDEVIKKWDYLVYHVLINNFLWAVRSTGSGSYRKLRRSLQFDDLIQEGRIGLLLANESFEEDRGATFKTYAYRAIRNTMLRYIDSNYSLLKSGRVWEVYNNGSEDLQACHRAAMNYDTFSELEHKHKASNMDTIPFVPVPSRAEQSAMDPALLFEERDFLEVCLKKLKDGLPERDYKMLMLRYQEELGFEQIAKICRVSKQTVANTLERLNYQIRTLLFSEIEEYGHDCGRSKSIAHQN